MAKRRDIVPRTMDALREDGWLVAVVEIPAGRGRPRRDLFGLWDVLAVKGLRTKVVQVAGPGERLEHHRKILRSPHWPAMLATSWELEQWTWSDIYDTNKDGSQSKKRIWRPVVDNLRLVMWPDAINPTEKIEV